jgi:hypothetical protein
MRVRAKAVTASQLTPKEAFYLAPTQTFVTPGKDYSVYCVSLYDTVTFVLHVDDLNTPTFTPAFHFDVVDARVDTDWICTLHPSGSVQLVLGPAYVAKDLESYGGMVDQREPQLAEFWRRIDRGEAPPPFPAPSA